MIQKLRNLALSVGLFSLVAAPFALTASVYADTLQDLKCGSNFQTAPDPSNPGNCNTDDSSGLSLPKVMKFVINILSVIVGFIAVVMIIVGGVRYVTSGGDSNNVSAAKNTIIYAVIGLVIVAIAQVLVHFVLNKLGDASKPTATGTPV